MVGVLPALGAAIGFAVFQVVNARALSRVDVYRGTRVLLVMGTLALGTVTMITEGVTLWTAAPPRALVMSAIAGMLHFFLGWTFLGLAQQRIGAARTGALIGAVPLFGALLAWGFLGEPLVFLQVAGLFVVVAGVAIIATGNRKGAVREAGLVTGVLAALGTALCWSISPIFIRQGLEGIPSPSAAASVGLLTSALLYSALVAIGRRGKERVAIERPTRVLLGIGGTLVALSLWMQWTAFDLAVVAVVLVILQLTPALVPILARIGAPKAGLVPLSRIYPGIAGIVGGSLLVILGG